MHDKLIEIITTSTFYLSKEKNENDMTFCYFSCLGQYCFQPTSMAALSPLALTQLLQGKAIENRYDIIERPSGS